MVLSINKKAVRVDLGTLMTSPEHWLYGDIFASVAYCFPEVIHEIVVFAQKIK